MLILKLYLCVYVKWAALYICFINTEKDTARKYGLLVNTGITKGCPVKYLTASHCVLSKLVF